MRTRSELTLEMDKMIVINRVKKKWSWCAPCMSHVEMITIEDAALRAAVESHDIVECLKDGLLHYQKGIRGLLLVCANSLIPAE